MTTEPTLNPDARPYATYPDCPASPDCQYCEEGAEYSAGHAHEIYENREGASHRTADELADIFLDSVEFYAAPWRRPADCPRDVSGWLDDPDDAQWLSDCVSDGELALSDVGLSVYWNDGYVIERVTEPTTVCAVCGEPIRHESETHWQGWLDETDDQLSYVPTLHDHIPTVGTADQ